MNGNFAADRERERERRKEGRREWVRVGE